MDAGPVAPPVRFRLEGAVLSWATLLLLVVIWGSAFAALRIAVTTIDPVWTVAGRLVSALAFVAVVMLIVARGKGERPVERITVRYVMAYGTIGVAFTAAPCLLYAIAAETTPSAVMAICNGATPFVTVIAARLFLGDSMTPGRIIGVLLGFAGLTLLVWPEAQRSLGQADGQGGGMLLGVLLAIIGAALYAGGNVGTRMAPPLSALTSSFIIIATGTVAAVLAAVLMAPFPTGASVESLLSVLFLGLLPTGFAMILYVWLIRRAGPVFVSFTTYLSPLWATFIGVTFMNEHLNWAMFGALALIFLGVAAANPPVRRR